MKSIAVDIGNSSIKLAMVPADGESWNPILRWRDASEFRDEFPAPATWWISSVHRGRSRQLIDWIQAQRRGDIVRELVGRDVPLRMALPRPDKVGLDRLCAALAAFRRGLAKPCIVVDAGTAVTVDAVSANGEFLGGSIFVGPQAALDYLAQTTDALPRIKLSPEQRGEHPLGKSTEDALISGAILATAGGITEIVRRIREIIGAPAQLFITGGAAAGLVPLLPFDCIFVEHLVLEGIAAVGRGLEKRHA